MYIFVLTTCRTISFIPTARSSHWRPTAPRGTRPSNDRVTTHLNEIELGPGNAARANQEAAGLPIPSLNQSPEALGRRRLTQQVWAPQTTSKGEQNMPPTRCSATTVTSQPRRATFDRYQDLGPRSERVRMRAKIGKRRHVGVGYVERTDLKSNLLDLNVHSFRAELTRA
jgi:hypothetical protein